MPIHLSDQNERPPLDKVTPVAQRAQSLLHPARFYSTFNLPLCLFTLSVSLLLLLQHPFCVSIFCSHSPRFFASSLFPSLLVSTSRMDHDELLAVSAKDSGFKQGTRDRMRMADRLYKGLITHRRDWMRDNDFNDNAAEFISLILVRLSKLIWQTSSLVTEFAVAPKSIGEA